VSTVVGQQAEAAGHQLPPDWSPVPPRGGGGWARLRAIAVRAVAAVAIAGFLWWRDHRLAAAVLVALALALTAASTLSPAISSTAERIEAAIRRYAGRALALVLLSVVYVLVFVPAWLLLRLLAINPLEMGQRADAPSAWRPALKHPRRALYDRPFAYDRIPPSLGASRGLRLRAALGLLVLVIAVDLGLGAALEGLERAPSSSARDAEVNLLSAPDTPAGANEPWRAQLGHEIGRAWVNKRYDPFLSWRMLDYDGRYVNISGGVRRSYQPTGADGPDAITIYFLGGSTMFGSFQRDVHTIPSEFARLAEADGVPVRVVNYGQLAYVNWQEVLLLERLASGPSRPDLAVLYDGYNDLLSQFALGHHREPTTLDAPEIEQRLQLGDEPNDPSVWRAAYDAWRDTSAVYRLGRELGIVGGSGGTAFQTPWASQQRDRPALRGTGAVAVQRRGVEVARGVGRQLGFETAFFWQPTIYSKRVVAGEEGALHWVGADPQAWRTATRAARAQLAPPVVDLSRALDEQAGPVMYDSAHTNEAGARAVAAAMYERLRPRLEELARR
jgi:hypothetical protein